MKLSKTTTLTALLLCAYAVSASPVESEPQLEQDGERDSRLFNLQFLPFITVNVEPTVCTAKSDNSTGTCTTKNQCTNEGGKEDGTCANGYGVCCVYEKRCGGKVNRNVTYLVNDDYPEPLKDIDNCQYNIEKASPNVCQLRLDFLAMTLQGPDTTSTCTKDTFTFVGTAGSNPTVICGQNTGQHMYLDLAQGSGAARINIATTDSSTDRSWRIKVTQIPCDSVSRAPPHCLQYHTDYSGTISSFNYQADVDATTQLADQMYTACIRTREGFCGIKYTAEDFSLSGDATEDTGTASSGDEDCTADFVLIPAVGKDGTVAVKDRFCGTDFVDLITYSQPFEVRVMTNSEEPDGDDVQNKGFSMRYTQIPC